MTNLCEDAGELTPTFVIQNFVLWDKIKRKRSGQTSFPTPQNKNNMRGCRSGQTSQA